MSSKYDIDFTQQTNSQLPPNKRLPKYTSWVKAIVAAFQWLHDNIFNDYDLGGAYPFYDSAATYNVGDRTIDIDNGIYESNVSQTGITPSQNYLPTATVPLPPWTKIAATYIGAQERLKYRGQKLSLEFALNRFFRTTFRQPTAIPDIYIQNNDWSEFFYIGGSDPEGSFFYGGNTTGDGYIINDNTAELPMFTIFVPDSALSPRPGWYSNGINADGFGEEKIRDFADQYVVAGILYTIDTY